MCNNIVHKIIKKYRRLNIKRMFLNPQQIFRYIILLVNNEHALHIIRRHRTIVL